MDSKSLKKFQSVSPKDQSCEIWLKDCGQTDGHTDDNDDDDDDDNDGR